MPNEQAHEPDPRLLDVLGKALGPNGHEILESLMHDNRAMNAMALHTARFAKEAEIDLEAKENEELFHALTPIPFLRCEPLYRIHAKELITRYLANESLDPGTEGEVLLGLFALADVELLTARLERVLVVLTRRHGVMEKQFAHAKDVDPAGIENELGLLRQWFSTRKRALEPSVL